MAPPPPKERSMTAYTDNQSLFAPSTSSERFQEYVHLIPSQPTYPKSTFKSYLTGLMKSKKEPPKRYDPLIMKLPFIIGTPLVILSLGIALEVGIILSQSRGGFQVPIENKLGFLGSTQFLLSIAPLPLILPNAILYRELDWMIRYYQPYIVLSNGRADAVETLLLDYVALGNFWGMLYAMKFRHRLVFLSCFTAVLTYLLQPLASSIFSVSPAQYTEPATVTSLNSIGLAPDVNTLSSFVAAAGFSDAAVIHGLDDPPFINGGWATAVFTFPPPTLNGTMEVNTTGILSDPRCERPASPLRVDDVGQGNFTITAWSPKGCQHTVNFNPNDAVSQYGVIAAPCDEYVDKQIDFQPVMFWFFNQPTGDYDAASNQADAIFCFPSIEVFRVNAVANLDNGQLQSCRRIDDYLEDNTVTGAPLNGDAYNGVVFDERNMNNFVRARSSATRTGVSGAIFKAAENQADGLAGTFDLPNGFLDLTTQVYRQHLAVSAKSVYFISENSTLESIENAFQPRLFVNAVPGHFLAVILFTIGIFGLILHIASRRARRNLCLGAPPGTIAHTVALTAHSGFGQLLFPYDSATEIQEKLKGLKFSLDKRTGAIVADEDLRDIDELAAYPLLSPTSTAAVTPSNMPKDWPTSQPSTPQPQRSKLSYYPEPPLPMQNLQSSTPSSIAHANRTSLNESVETFSQPPPEQFYQAGGARRDVVDGTTGYRPGYE